MWNRILLNQKKDKHNQYTIKLNKEDISCIYERENSKKIGFKVPGTNIPIVSDKNLYKCVFVMFTKSFWLKNGFWK